MRVFLSSVVKGFEAFREAAASGISALKHKVSRSEDFGALEESSQRACLRGVREADVVVLLMGERYGAKQVSGASATHEEWIEAREHCPVLVFVQEGVEPDPDQSAFIRDVREWATGHASGSFRNAEELRNAVTLALHSLELRQATGPVDADELVSRAAALIPKERNTSTPKLCLAMACGPRQVVLRPATLEDPGFRRRIMQDAQYGDPPVLTTTQGLAVKVANDRLYLDQEDAGIVLGHDGSLCLTRSASPPEEGRDRWMPVLIEEDIARQVEDGLRFFGRTLDTVDSLGRLTDVAIALAVVGAGHHAWRTREEHQRSPGSIQLGMGRKETVIVNATPPIRKRPALTQQTATLAEDLVVLMRREFK